MPKVQKRQLEEVIDTSEDSEETEDEEIIATTKHKNSINKLLKRKQIKNNKS